MVWIQIPTLRYFYDSFLIFQDLKDYFRSAGEITYTNVHHQRQGDGIVEFANRRGLDYALDHKVIIYIKLNKQYGKTVGI